MARRKMGSNIQLQGVLRNYEESKYQKAISCLFCLGKVISTANKAKRDMGPRVIAKTLLTDIPE